MVKDADLWEGTLGEDTDGEGQSQQPVCTAALYAMMTAENEALT